jgi:hypothetical protein
MTSLAQTGDDTLRWLQGMIQEGSIDSTPATMTEVGGVTEYDIAGEFKLLKDRRDGSLFKVRVIDAPRYEAKRVRPHDLSDIPAGELIYEEPSLSTGGASIGVAPDSSVKPKRRRKRHRKKRVSTV